MRVGCAVSILETISIKIIIIIIIIIIIKVMAARKTKRCAYFLTGQTERGYSENANHLSKRYIYIYNIYMKTAY